MDSLNKLDKFSPDTSRYRTGYFVLLLTLIVVLIREGSSSLPFIDYLRLLKYPIALFALLVVLRNLFSAWRNIGREQKKFVFLSLLVLSNGLLSLAFNPNTGRLSYFIILGEWICLSIGTTIFFQSQKQMTALFVGFVLIAIANAISGVTENAFLLAEIDFSVNTEFGRLGGFGLDPNYFSMLLSLPLGYVVVLSSNPDEKLLKRVLFAAISAFLVFSIMWSRSRSGLLSVLVIFVVVISLRRLNGFPTTILLYMAGVMVVLFVIGRDESLNVYYGIVSRWEILSHSSALGRLELWKASFQNVLSRPVWGWGSGSLEVLLDLGKYQGSYGYIKPHNAWIVVAIERGFIGVFLQLAMLAFGFKAAWQLYWRTESAYKEIGIASIVGLFGQALMSLTLGGMPLELFIVSAGVVALSSQFTNQFVPPLEPDRETYH